MKLKKSLTIVPFEFKLRKALCFYKNDKTSNTLAVMFDSVKNELKNPSVYNGEQVRGLMPDESRRCDIYLPNTLYYNVDKMAWWVKGGMRHLDIIKGKRIQFRLPRLVFKVERNKLFVASFKGEPSADTELFFTPFRGIDVHASTMGACNVVKPRGQKMSDREEWENAFFMSKFNQEPQADLCKQPLNKTLSEFIFQ